MERTVLQQVMAEAEALFEPERQIWERYGIIPSWEEERRRVMRCAANACENGVFAADYTAACLCFYLFRKFHGMAEREPKRATLLGDYFFSRFSHHLIPIDNTRLIDLFSGYLKGDAKRAGKGDPVPDTEDYLEFIRNAAKETGL